MKVLHERKRRCEQYFTLAIWALATSSSTAQAQVATSAQVPIGTPKASAPDTPLPAIYALAYSLDGKTLAVGTNREALLYDTKTWSVTQTCNQLQNAARSFAFHPDGKHLAIGSGVAGVSGCLTMIDTTDPTHAINYEPAGDTIESMAFNKDGSEMLTASFDSKARLYPVAFYPYSPLRLEEHNGRVSCVAFSSKPKYIFATGAMDKMVKIWDRKTTKVVVNFDQATAGITGVAFLGNGDQLVGSSMDGNLYWWGVNYNERKNTYSGYPFRTIKAHEDGVTAFSASSNLQRIATGGMDHRVRVWRMDDGGEVREFKEPNAPIYCTALSPDGKIVAAAGREGVVWVWDVEANKLITTFSPPRAAGKQPVASRPEPSDKRAAPGPVAGQPVRVLSSHAAH